MKLDPVAERLLADLAASHEALIDRTGAGEAERSAFHAVYSALESALFDVPEPELTRAPSPDEWSMAEVVEHVAEHDRKYVELMGQGLTHYIEHGLEHAMQVWRMRPQSIPD